MFSGLFHTFLWACLPFLEIRASIPLGYLRYDLSIYESAAVSVVSLMMTTAVLIYMLPRVVRWCDRHSPFFDRILKKIFAHTRNKHSHKAEVFGNIAFVLFVAVPLPGSGAWTGVLLAYLFGMHPKKTFFLASLGIIFSAIIISLITIFGFEVWEFLTL